MNIFWDYVLAYDFGTLKSTQKIITALWKRCGIRQIYFQYLEDMLMVLTNFCFKFFYCHICEYCWGFISFLRFWHSKYHPKNCHSSLRKVWNQRNLLSLFQIHVNRFDKIVIQIFFVTVVNIFELMFSFQGFSTHRKKEKVTRASLNGCRIVYSCLHPLEYIIWFPLK